MWHTDAHPPATSLLIDIPAKTPLLLEVTTEAQREQQTMVSISTKAWSAVGA
jgi:hypothetical protein